LCGFWLTAKRVRSVLILAAWLLGCATAALTPAPASATTIPADLNKVITTIFVPDAHDTPVPNGDGFFVVVKDVKRPDNAYGYLITAKHVLETAPGQFYDHIFVKLNKIKGGTQLLRVDLQDDGKSQVFTRPEPGVDIAVVPALPDASVYDFRAIPEEMIQSPKAFDDLEIGEGSDIFFVSPLQGYGAAQETVPVARFGHITLVPSRPLAWRPNPTQPATPARFFLVEGQSSGGDAGAPVFLTPNPDDAIESFITQTPLFKLVGVVMGSYNDMATTTAGSAGLPPTAAMIARAAQSANVEAVAPSLFLYQIIFSDELKKLRGGDSVEQANK
jgi:hypothetical protein